MDELLEAAKRHHEPGWARAYPLWCSVVRDHNLDVGAELGVAFGGHSEAMLQNTRIRRLYSVDMFRHDPNYDDPLNFPQGQFDDLFAGVKSRLAPFGDRCELLRMESAEAAAAVPDELDFVYIDANHSFDGVWRDLGLWARKVRDGGILGGHDYGHPDFPGVRTAVDRFCRRFGWQIHEAGEGVWWTLKSKVRMSFIVPAFNCAATIGETLDSITNGNLQEGDEIIIIDDASTDGTPRILARLPGEKVDLKVLRHRVNKGSAAAARNTGIEEASNSLIFCLDSDNVLTPGSVCPLANHLRDTGADAAAFGEVHYFRSTRRAVTHKWVYKDIITLADALAGVVWPGPSGNYLFTKESWLRAGRYHEPSLENRSLDSWTFGIRQLATGSRLVTLPHTWYFHRYGHESHYVQNWQKGNQSLAALIALMPFLDQLEQQDVEYLFSQEGRYSWYPKLRDRPLSVKAEAAGEDGRIHLSALYRREEFKRIIRDLPAKIRARLLGGRR